VKDRRVIETVLASLDSRPGHGDMEWFWCEAAVLRERRDPLRHPFVVAWSHGELEPGNLFAFATEYDHVVAAAEAAYRRLFPGGCSAKGGLLRLWRGFARTVGWDGVAAWHYAEEPLEETLAFVDALRGPAPQAPEVRLASLYAFESVEADLSRVQLRSLRDRARLDRSSTTAYFEVRQHQGAERADLAQSALSPALAGADAAALLDQIDAVHRARWRFLDALVAP
jgi:pyrroloquinoline quinone (PQQ) biosynthesis protein C